MGCFLHLYFLPILRSRGRRPYIVINFRPVNCSVFCATLSCIIGRRRQRNKGKRVTRLLRPHKPPLCGKVLRFRGIYIAVIVLQKSDNAARRRPANKADLSLQHVLLRNGFTESGKKTFFGIKLCASHRGRIFLDILRL